MTTLTAPISKLYKRCQWNHHGECPGHFDYSSGQTYSVCSCACHAGVSDMRAAEVVDAASEWITQHAEIATANSQSAIDNAVSLGFKGAHRVGHVDDTAGKYSDQGKNNINSGKLMRWTEHFHMCAKHAAGSNAQTFADSNRNVKSDDAALYVRTCDDCNAATKQAMREYALTPAYARTCATKVLGANYQSDHLAPVYLK